MLYLTCAACLDWSRREDIQTGTVKGRLRWTGRRYLAGTVRDAQAGTVKFTSRSAGNTKLVHQLGSRSSTKIKRRTKGTVYQTLLSVSVKTAKRQRLNKSKRQRIGISQPDESYSNLLNQSQDRALEPDERYSNPDASYSALETVAVYNGLQN
ncbi:hypothetical protein F511_40767 [Dorcoceras hygrometricum]|uniref:Uncharacterized protein n=1 Tax=Dorcoceras hygrometricum TaxID=472368 RepID=A0A2Z7B884_9LAMI|nr:hypothetical protein F511_40767 [Dorcoceras hygrometricum]